MKKTSSTADLRKRTLRTTGIASDRSRKAPEHLMELILCVNQEYMKKTYKFYHDVIGLAYKNRPNPGWVVFKTGDADLVIHCNPSDSWKPQLSNVIISLSFKDRDKVMGVHDKLMALGYKRLAPSILQFGQFVLQYQGNKEAIAAKRHPEVIVRDPFGHRINIKHRIVKNNP